jgi:acyl dehydratase
VRAGSRIRGRGEIVSAEPVAGGVQVKIRVTVEVEGSDKPGCVADTLSRWLFQ